MPLHTHTHTHTRHCTRTHKHKTLYTHRLDQTGAHRLCVAFLTGLQPTVVNLLVLNVAISWSLRSFIGSKKFPTQLSTKEWCEVSYSFIVLIVHWPKCNQTGWRFWEPKNVERSFFPEEDGHSRLFLAKSPRPKRVLRAVAAP